MMNAEVVNPCLVSIVNVLEMMAKLQCKPGAPFMKSEKTAYGEVTGLMGMECTRAQGYGSVAITFSRAAILEITTRMVGQSLTAINATVRDMVGELTNMMTGNVKSMLVSRGYDFDMKIPDVFVGVEHEINHKTNAPTLIIPFTSCVGDFFIEVSFAKPN